MAVVVAPLTTTNGLASPGAGEAASEAVGEGEGAPLQPEHEGAGAKCVPMWYACGVCVWGRVQGKARQCTWVRSKASSAQLHGWMGGLRGAVATGM